MSSLSPDPLTLHGSCNCKAIQYTLDIPSLSARPIWASASATPEGKDVRAPFFCTDHCDDCRRATGSLLPCWIICPRTFCEFSCLKRSTSPTNEADNERETFTGDAAVSPSPRSESTFLTHYASSDRVWRSFCGRCGTNMAYGLKSWPDPDLPATIDIPMGTLGREDLMREGVRVQRHLWWDHGIGWIRGLVTEGDGSARGRGEGLPRNPIWDVREAVKE